MKNLIVAPIFVKLPFFTLFGEPYELNWGQKASIAHLSTESGMPAFLKNFSLTEFLVSYLALFLFLVIRGFGLFWMGNLHKNIQLMLELLKAPFLVLHFHCYTLMTIEMMLYVILLSMLMILLSAVNVIRHLTSGNN